MNRSYAFPWVNFNAVQIVRIATISSTFCFCEYTGRTRYRVYQPAHASQFAFKISCEIKILQKVEILVSFMPALVAVEVARVVDSMFTV